MVIVAVNFHPTEAFTFPAVIPAAVRLNNGQHSLKEMLAGERELQLQVENGDGRTVQDLTLPPLAAFAYCLQQ
jgi:hypothetical protein